jgi:UDP-N-acetylglucosamine--N-acetylmuramyl-(pentapeptide) pyrophosphoryl-undecaprenol N-acetylglucosamine transferase
MKVMITGGGTGGHTSPAVAIIEELRRRDPHLLVQWVGKKGGVEERVAARMDVPFRDVPVEGWPRNQKLRRAWVAVKMAAGLARATAYLRKFRPQVVIGVGGYVSVPLLWAAQRFGVPTVLHEQNTRLGMANRLLADKASRIYLSYPDTRGELPADRVRVTGNPVRAGFASPPDRRAAKTTMELDPDLPAVLVVGGSQGARSINQAVAAALPAFRAGEAQFLWMTGPDGANAARDAAARTQTRTIVFSFIEDMVTACAAADLLVSRAGASTTAEAALMGRPAILIPYPHAADNHQEANARAFEEAGAGVLLLDADCDGERVGALVRNLLADAARLEKMGVAAHTLARPGAAEVIVEDIFELVFGPVEKTPRGEG